MNKFLRIILPIIIATALSFGIGYYMHLKSQPRVDAKGLMERIEDASELTVSKNYYTGIAKFQEGSIPIIDKNGFSMKYEAVIDAGFNLEEVKIDVTDKAVKITVPKATILSINIDPNSLEFYDNKISIFKTDRKEATKIALQEAKKDAEKNAAKKELLKNADERASIIFKGILSGEVGSRKIIVEQE